MAGGSQILLGESRKVRLVGLEMMEKREGKSAGVVRRMEMVGWEGRAAVQWWVKILGVLVLGVVGARVVGSWEAILAILGSKNGD